MQIPGQTRLGQGFPGGAGALSPGVTGRTPGLPTFSSTPRMQAPPAGMGLGSGTGMPSYAESTGLSYANPSASPLQRLGTTPSTKAYKMAEALQILERIRRGWLSEKNAARMLKRFPVEIRRQLADELGTDSKDAVTLVKKLQIRPEDLGAYSRDEGKPGFLQKATKVGRAGVKDVENMVVGSIPEGYRAAKAFGADVADIAGLAAPGAALRGRSAQEQFTPLKETRKQVIDPMIEQYKYMYGPAMPGTPGGVGETLHRMGEHPLQPVMDAAALVSAGIGTSARIASATRAVRAAKVGRVPKPDVAGTMRPLPAEALDAEPWRGIHPGYLNTKTGQAIWGGEEIDGHYALGDILEARGVDTAADEWVPVTGIIDPETGKAGAVNATMEGEGWEGLIDESGDIKPELKRQIDTMGKSSLNQALGVAAKEPSLTTVARKGFMRPEHRGSLIEAYERMGGLALGERFKAAKAAAGFATDETPEGPEMPGEGPPAVPPEPGAPEAPVLNRPTPENPSGEVDEFGMPLEAWNPKTFENNQTTLGDDFIEVSAAVDRETGQIYTSERAHTEMTDDLAGISSVEEAWGTADQPGRFDQFTVIADREGKVHAINGKDMDFRTTDAEPAPEIADQIRQQVEAKFARGRELDEARRSKQGDVDFTRAHDRIDSDLDDLAEYMAPEEIAEAREVIRQNLEDTAREPATELADKLGPGWVIQPVIGRGQALDDLAGGDTPWRPVFDVKMGTGEDWAPGFTAWKEPGKDTYTVHDTIEITDKDFFPDQESVDKYMDAVEKVQGHDPDEMLTLYRAMSKTEKDIWDRGETIPIGKWLTSEETDQYAKDTMGEFPGLYKYKVRRGDVVEMSPGQFQLKGASRLDGDTIKAGGKGTPPPSDAAHRPDLETPEEKPDLAEALSDFDREMSEAEARVGAQPTGTIGGEPTPKRDLKAGLGAFFERQQAIDHAAELKTIEDGILDSVNADDLRLKPRSFKEILAEVKSDLKATRLQGKQRPQEMSAKLPGFISAGSTGRVLSMAETSLREASDLVRAGAIYLRPAYLPNNWASNAFMNVAQQGVFAPMNLAKSLVMDKHIGKHYTSIMDSTMGTTAAQVVTAAKGRGYVGSLANPIAETMGKIADTPFRRAALMHELRRKNYHSLSDVKGLLDKVVSGDERALRELADAGRKAQEEIVKFGKYNEMESSILRNIVFVYSWMRGAGRFAGRFPMQHPIQAAAAVHLGQEGREWLNSELGGVPSFLQGAIPVGRDKDGNPILVNPFTLNPLGTGLDIARAAKGTLEVIQHPNEFNKYAEEDIVGLLNPIIQAYAEAREGGNPPAEEAMRAIAPIRLQNELRHPGSGGVYPTSRKEAIGKYMFGTLFPRQADQAAITRAVERENVGARANLIPQQIKQYKKMTGQDLPEEMITAYRRDLQMADDIKDFQRNYADDHGSQGFRNMPPINRVKAAIEFHRQAGVIDEQQLNRIEVSLQGIRQDVVLNDLANGLWAATGVGGVRRTWDQMFKDAKGLEMTRERP